MSHTSPVIHDICTVVNLSNAPLSEAENNLLSKGLSFCPTPPKIDTFRVKEDLNTFFRRLRLKEFFHDEDNTEEREPINPFKKKSNWNPPKNRESALETYIQAKQRTANNHLEVSQRHRLRDNLTRDERIALKTLQNRTDIVIKPADKGSAVVDDEP